MYRVSPYHLICLIFMVFVLVACGGAEDMETAVSSNPAPTATIKDPTLTVAPEQDITVTEAEDLAAPNPDIENMEEMVEETIEDVADGMATAMEAGEELDNETINDIAEEAIEENLAEILDEDEFGDVDVEDLPLPLACDILAQLDLEALAGGPVAPPDEEFAFPEIAGSPYHISSCAFYTPVELEDTEPYRSVSLTVSQPKPGAETFAPEKALDMYIDGMVSTFDIAIEEVDVEEVPGFGDDIAFWSFEQLTLYRQDGAILKLTAGEGYLGTPENTLELANAVQSILP